MVNIKDFYIVIIVTLLKIFDLTIFTSKITYIIIYDGLIV